MRNIRNEEFVRRLFKRRADAKARHGARLAAAEGPGGLEALTPGLEIAYETIVREERPVLFVKGDRIEVNVAGLGVEADELVKELGKSAKVTPLLPLIGRIDVQNFPNNEFLGTGWFIDDDIVVTNRHVATLIARYDGGSKKFVFSRGVAGRPIISSLCTARERDDGDPNVARVFAVKEVLYIESDAGPNDIAFLRVDRRPGGTTRSKIDVAASDAAVDTRVVVVGYPARAPKHVIPNQQKMDELYQKIYDVKRAAPGLVMPSGSSLGTHDATTLGGNSGSVVVDIATGEAVGLHFAGLYQEANYAVRASVLNEYTKGQRWNRPFEIETQPAPTTAPAATASTPSAPIPSAVAAGGSVTTSVTLTIPLTINVELGTPSISTSPAGVAVAAAAVDHAPIDVARVEGAANAFYAVRPAEVLSARVGFFDEDGEIGERPFIAASVRADRLEDARTLYPKAHDGVPIRYIPAKVDEQIESRLALEAVAIAYDDGARKGSGFSFAFVNEEMEVDAHVGPEYSWEKLSEFIAGAKGEMVAAMYEFHGPHIKDAFEESFAAHKLTSLELALDNVTFKALEREPDDEKFDRAGTFEEWADEKKVLDRVVVPIGGGGLVQMSYHIKVAVRQDDVFWLSSGNWKIQSSQPIVTDEDRANATETDLPGNREWHVIIKNTALATRFRNHIRQDIKRSRDLGGRELPKSWFEATVVVPGSEETLALERRPPSRVLAPRKVSGKIKVKPLLTPDREGAIYSEAVLELIESAEESLLFQIPYIGMPPKPNADRGWIDELIKALTKKLKTLDDARVILRSGSSGFSEPRHAAWYFKSKGVDIKNRLRLIDDSHTKGMIVDGRRVLIGSHNWSGLGVSVNRDASLIFHNEEIAEYYAGAFEIDWERSRPITPMKFEKEGLGLEGVGPSVPFRRVPLSDLLGDP